MVAEDKQEEEAYNEEDESESAFEFGFYMDKDDLFESWDGDDRWDFVVQVDPARQDEENVECFNFMDSKFGQQLRLSAPVRLVCSLL